MNTETETTTTTAPAFTVTVKRGRADRLDNRATKTYGAVLRFYIELDIPTQHHAAMEAMGWGMPADDLVALVRGYLRDGGARAHANDMATREVRPCYDGPAALAVAIEVRLRAPKEIPADLWAAVDCLAMESFLHATASKLMRRTIAAGEDINERAHARAVVRDLMSTACDVAERTGGFEARFAALRAERDAARREALRTINSDVRGDAGWREEHGDRVMELATDPGVRVFFSDGPLSGTRVYLAGEETPGEKRAEGATA